ncbi:glycosyltransferase [Enterobacter asburiae]|nr:MULTISPECIES: glycosyltransferase [Enterobacter]MCF1339922.1 glycosyltransferase [Enterobacter asburiae]MCM6996261.1 glycosyltransferase [Enterobacter asburiae]MCQ4338303.1 glycosyltransferase [Enterobacter asburiae]PWI79869.1 glycosyltransferase [Enterobacter sp. CGMCC 5087]
MINNEHRYMVVSATALASGGALTILRQFVSHASKDNNKYLIFVPQGLHLPKYDNIIYIENERKGWFKRIYWDWFGCKSFLKKKCINVKKVISLQNSSLNVPYEQIIYLHQPIPFSEIHSFFKNLSVDNFKLFLYKTFYSFFIFKFVSKSTIFVVQTDWMKTGVLKRCNKLSPEQIEIIKPDIKAFTSSVELDGFIKEENTLLYPATPLSYKNHMIILKALSLLKKSYNRYDIKFKVTFNKGLYKNFDDYIARNALEENVEYLGVLSYQDLQKIYEKATIIVFPSYIESYGLPLIEAASLGKKIICSDLPYSRDVLSGYEGAIFVDYNSEIDWAQEIHTALQQGSDYHYKKFENDSRSSWPQFFELLK